MTTGGRGGARASPSLVTPGRILSNPAGRHRWPGNFIEGRDDRAGFFSTEIGTHRYPTAYRYRKIGTHTAGRTGWNSDTDGIGLKGKRCLARDSGDVLGDVAATAAALCRPGLSTRRPGGSDTASHGHAPTQARRPRAPCAYHLASRCVRRAWLCGRDKPTGRDYSHRKRWLLERLLLLARCFAVEVYAYAVMSNHFHIVVHYDPKACLAWSDEEVAQRWVDAFPPKAHGAAAAPKAEARSLLLGDPDRLARARHTLGSLSDFMKHLKQPIARRANEEDGCDGHFFEQRFYSGALLGEQAMLAAMAYVDLNPVRAKLAQRIEECRDSSVGARLRENSATAKSGHTPLPHAPGIRTQPVSLSKRRR